MDYIFSGFLTTIKIIKLFNIFTVFPPKKYKNIANSYQKELFWCFSDIKMWSSNNVLNCYTSNWMLFKEIKIKVTLTSVRVLTTFTFRSSEVRRLL